LGSFDENSAELRAALAALKAQFGRYVAAGPVLLIGYAEGAAMAADLARQEPSFFSRVALVLGEPSTVSSIGAKVFAERGGKRMLFFCDDLECRDAGAERALWLTRRGVAAKAVQAAVGPYFDRAFADALSPELPWLIEGDARWSKPPH
jgi:poly(3-hydroxybutyrate) depolymerase